MSILQFRKTADHGDRIIKENLRKLHEIPWLYGVSQSWSPEFDRIEIVQNLAPLDELLRAEAKRSSTIGVFVYWESRSSDGHLFACGVKKIEPSDDGRCWATQIMRQVNPCNAIGNVVEFTSAMHNKCVVYRDRAYWFNNRIEDIAHRHEAMNGFPKSMFIPGSPDF